MVLRDKRRAKRASEATRLFESVPCEYLVCHKRNGPSGPGSRQAFRLQSRIATHF
jgi:hypothetical protein